MASWFFGGLFATSMKVNLFIPILGYHHRGGDPDFFHQGPSFTQMGPKEGVPEMARSMMPELREMVGAYKVGCQFGPGEGGLG